MNQSKVIVKSDHEEASTYGAFLIGKIIKNELKRKKEKLNIAFSGGNTPILMFEKLAKLSNINWSQINIFVVDERYVSTSHSASNFYNFNTHLIDKIDIPSENIYYIKYLQGIEKSLQDYELQIKEAFNLKKKEDIPQFDFIHLGIGKDGHTASIFNPARIDNDRLLAITEDKKYKRITFTYRILNKASHILFLVTGQEKSKVVFKVIKQKTDYPASRVDNEGKLYYLLDKEAASQL